MSSTIEKKRHGVVASIYNGGKPLLFVVLSVLIASTAETLSDLLTILVGRKNGLRPLPPVPSLDKWLPMYRSHRRMWDKLLTIEGFGPDLMASGFQGDVRQFAKIPEQERRMVLEEIRHEDAEAFESILKIFCPIPYPPNEDVLRLLLTDFEVAADVKDSLCWDEFMLSVEGQFFFRVWLPCWILYRTYPPNLMWKARRGCIESLDKLVRLDKSTAADPVIARRLHSIQHGSNKRNVGRIQRAYAQGPKGKLDRKAIKIGLTGLISQVAIAFDCPVTAQEIWGLFNSIATVRDDLDQASYLTDGHALTKGIQRNRNWPSPAMRRPDKK